MNKPLKWLSRREEPSPGELERLELEESLRDTQVRIAQAYAGFNSAVDGELVESFVYEIQALKARYSYLLRARKQLEAQPVPLQAAGALQGL